MKTIKTLFIAIMLSVSINAYGIEEAPAERGLISRIISAANAPVRMVHRGVMAITRPLDETLAALAIKILSVAMRRPRDRVRELLQEDPAEIVRLIRIGVPEARTLFHRFTFEERFRFIHTYNDKARAIIARMEMERLRAAPPA